MVVAEVILPVFFVVFLGFLLKRFSDIDEGVFSKVQLYILSPALIFVAMARAEAGTVLVLRLLLYVYCLALVILAVAQSLSIVSRRSREERYAISMTAVLMNAGFYGIPVCMLAFGQMGLIYASIFVVTSATVQATLGVYLANAGTKRIGDALLMIIKVPLIHAIVVAKVLVYFNSLPPQSFMKMIEMLGNAAIPLGLLLLGMQLSRIMSSKRISAKLVAETGEYAGDAGTEAGMSGVDVIPGSRGFSGSDESKGIAGGGEFMPLGSNGSTGEKGLLVGGVMAGMGRIVLGLFVALLLLKFFDFDRDLERVIIVESSMPTAVNAVVYATEFNCKPKLVAMGILFSTLVSIISLYLIITYVV